MQTRLGARLRISSLVGGWPGGPVRPLLVALGGLLLGAGGCDDQGNPPDWRGKVGDVGEAGGDGGDGGAAEADGGGLPEGALCREGEPRCWDEEKLATCLPGGVGWLVERCPEGELCLAAEGRCVRRECRPGQPRCAPEGEPAVQTCAPDGMSWSAAQPCAAGEGCLHGVCLARFCTPGEQLCGRDRLLTCGPDGLSWAEQHCPEGQVCYDGGCLGCVRDADCAAGMACRGGQCLEQPLAVLTTRLPAGMVGQPYAALLEAEGGSPPYAWSLRRGELPAGLLLEPGGRLSGTPEQAGEQPLALAVQDAAATVREVELLLRIHGSGLVVTTERLPEAEEGSEYRVQLQAMGGPEPYAWMIAGGELPPGLALLAGGALAGTPGAVGEFPLSFRVFDSSLPPQMAQKELQLRVRIAPLEIVGEQQYDLLLVKIIVLPMITVVENIPIPYSTQLQAIGGLRPYHWSEQPLADALRPFIPQSGIPEGLTLAENGTLAGAVTSLEQVISVTIPFTQITLNGFFFLARVEDSQAPPQSKSAVFLLPTLPIGGGGGGGGGGG